MVEFLILVGWMGAVMLALGALGAAAHAYARIRGIS
jgi:hypothetical protein